MTEKEAKVLIKEQKKLALIAKEKAKKEYKKREEKRQLLESVEQTRFIQQQVELHTTKEHQKLEQMIAEKNVRIDETLKHVSGEQKEELVQKMQLFEELHAVEVIKLADFKKKTEETLAILEEKIKKLG